MFTNKKLTRKQIQKPPVSGCLCTYCWNVRDELYLQRTGTIIEYRAPATKHDKIIRAKTGIEAHNPENTARLALKEVLPPKLFKQYLKKGYVQFQGESGLWYRPIARGNNGVMVWRPNTTSRNYVWLCVGPDEEGSPVVPQADVILAFYKLFSTNERLGWQAAEREYDFDDWVKFKWANGDPTHP